MKIIRAAKAGFCFGVKRAINMAENTDGTSVIASLGPLIHNRQVVESLAKQGIKVVNYVEEVNPDQTIIIRSHGVGPDVYAKLTGRGVTVVDATCPFVQKAQHLAAESAKNGRVVVVGDKNHPEVTGILGWAGEQAIPVENIEQARDLPYYSFLTVLAQTTQKKEDFWEIVKELRKHTDQLTVHNTICNATHERQDAARELAGKVEVMIVAGGRDSANSRKLAAICAEKAKTYLIETAAELQQIWFIGVKTAGLTAGASTPDWIIEEVYNKMTEIIADEAIAIEEKGIKEDFNMAGWDKDFQKIYRGAVVTGNVVKMTSEEVFVNIGWKSEGLIDLKELSSSPVTNPAEIVSVGDEVTAVVLRVSNEEGYVVLSKRRVGETDAINRLAELAESKEEISALVTEVVKGGLLVNVGVRGFVPASQVQLGYTEDLSGFVGQTLRLRVLEFNPAKRKVILSQKVILAEEREQKRAQLLESLKEGDVVKGIARRLTNFGVFVDLGGIDGLLHISEMSYSRISHPSELVNAEDEIEVQILKIDAENGRISLGLKQLKPSPWTFVAEKYPVGALINGKVVRIASFGAFVQLEDGVDALIHISQLANRHVAKVEEVVKVGDIICAKVIECNPEEKRISLSIRQAAEEAASEADAEAMAQQTETPEMTIGDALTLNN
ncbi:MAG: bifunctional 4-hydroxy-3-methylbut-2-enyl diphosphate reductase/30S ribosomal protein S1 [Desulfitobacteriaceae bacterium]|nr:bifunctional 4-hydroxy-3-methylbut-2-enyl diphosphate reductase/30S ribosomal protein S1 [Desulfitobacteriaceae bacterium]